MRVFATILLVGCGWSQERYDEEWKTTWCEQIIGCEYGELLGFQDEQDCWDYVENAQATAGEAECVDYDGVSAKECVLAYGELACDELFEPEAQPDACGAVCANSGE